MNYFKHRDDDFALFDVLKSKLFTQSTVWWLLETRQTQRIDVYAIFFLVFYVKNVRKKIDVCNNFFCLENQKI